MAFNLTSNVTPPQKKNNNKKTRKKTMHNRDLNPQSPGTQPNLVSFGSIQYNNLHPV